MESLALTLRQIAFFSELPREDLARVVGRLEQRPFAAGQVIFSQGEPGDGLYIVQAGAVEVVLEDGADRVQSLAVLGPYDCFGEMSLLTGRTRSATVRAVVDCVVLKLGKGTWDELLARNPSIALHFCKVLSERLGETNWYVSKGRGALNRILEEYLAGQPAPVRDFLIRTSILTTLDPEAIRSVVSEADPLPLLASFSAGPLALVRVGQDGRYEYLDYVRDFLSSRFEQTLLRRERSELHLRFARFFSARGPWAAAVRHYLKAEAWEEARREVEAHRDELLAAASPEQVLGWLRELEPHVPDATGRLVGLRAEALVRLGYLDAAIRSYQEFLARRPGVAGEIPAAAGTYQELAALHRKKGETAEALTCLRLGLEALGEGRGDPAVQAMQSIGALEQRGGSPEAALRWAERALHVCQQLQARARAGILRRGKRSLVLPGALAVGWLLWRLPPPAGLGEGGMRLLASLTAGVILWGFNRFDDHVVALLLLLVWLLSGLVPPDVALAGFASSSWFFFLSALGIGAAVTRSGLLYRLALQVLRRIRPNYTVYSLILAASGLLVTPVMPNIMARLAIMAPVSQGLAEAMGAAPRSNGSARLVLSAYIGYSQAAFMFMTGAVGCLLGWNLLPEPARAEFGWGRWVLAALPAGLVVLGALWGALPVLFPLPPGERSRLSPGTLETQLEVLGPLTGREWTGLAVLGVALAGWAGKPLHGVAEAWVALGAFLVFLMTGALDKDGLKNAIDWGFLLFFGVISSLAVMVPHLTVDRWVIGAAGPLLSRVAGHPLPFLLVTLVLTYAVRVFLHKFATIIVLSLGLTGLAQSVGIHPGVLLLTILMAADCWFLPYQDTNYQIVYYGTHERAFSHAQGRKLMAAKFVASLVAVTISVPYWRLLGLIR